MESVSPPSQREMDQPLPEAGHDPGDPLRPEVEEEDLPNPPVSAPHLDVEATEDNGDLSEGDSALSDLDDAEFEDFDPENIAIDERAAIAVDESNVGLLGVHKRKRAEGEESSKKKKKEGRREKPKRSKKQRSEGDSADGGEDAEGSRERASKKALQGRPRRDSSRSVERRVNNELADKMEAALRGTKSRARKKDGIDLEAMQDHEIEAMRQRMASAAQADTAAREAGKPAYHKLKMLPEVVELLNRNTIQHNIVDPDTNLLEAVRFFLEPLNDGSMPAYNIQRDLFTSLGKLPITKDALVASELGKVAWFYTKTTRAEPEIKRAAEKLLSNWTRSILSKSKKDRGAMADGAQAMRMAVRGGPVGDEARERLLETPNLSNRARAAVGPSQTYTVAPQSGVSMGSQFARAPGSSGDAAFNRMKARQMGKAGGGRRG